LDGALDSAGVPRNHDLLGRIDVGCLANFSLRRILGNFADLVERHPQNRCHRTNATGTASCIYLPRLRTVRTASAKASVPAATCAEYSPRLCPATESGFRPFSCNTRHAATEAVRMAGCVISVSFSLSSGPSKQTCESLQPSASSASSKVRRATG